MSVSALEDRREKIDKMIEDRVAEEQQKIEVLH
jgi:hypothetical protein